MHVNPYLIIEDEKYLVDDFKFGFRQKPNAAGVPIEVPVFEGLHVVIRGHYPGFFLERWACASSQSKLAELVLKPLVLGSGPTRVFTFFDAHLVDFTKNYSEKKNPPVEMILKITAGGVRDSFSKSEYAAPWRETFEKPSAVVLTPTESESPEPNPRITNSWLTETLPRTDDAYLKVSFSNRTLYFKTPTPNHKLPEFISYDGDPLLLMSFGRSVVTDKIKNKILDAATQKAEKAIQNIVFAKLSKANLVDANGNMHQGEQLIESYKALYDKPDELFENLEQNTAIKSTEKQLHAKGIEQYEYFSKTGKQVRVLGMVKNIGHALDIFNLVKTASDGLDTSKPLPLNLGPLTPLVDLAGVLVHDMKVQDDALLETLVQQDLDQAKLQGLAATRKWIQGYYDKRFRWELLPISEETANRLLQGEFETFQSLRDFSFKNQIKKNEGITILCRKVENKNRDLFIYIIETIFVYE